MIHASSLAAYPHEACGLLIGTDDLSLRPSLRPSLRHSLRHALRAVACRNLADKPDRFELHPEDFLAAELEARAAGQAVIGVWHSHPDQPAVPSDRDRKDAYDAWVHVICSVGAHDVHSVRSWRIAEGRLTELSIDSGD